jgi:hypothetical protein
MNYTTKVLTVEDLDDLSTLAFLYESFGVVNKMYGGTYNLMNCDIPLMVDKTRFVICYRDQIPVGFMWSSLHNHTFDPKLKILKQLLLHAQPGTRAARLLLKEFIDFGKLNANYIITTIGRETNIKSKSLEKLGFSKLEESYRLEVRR